MQRQTADLIAIILAVIVAIVVISTTAVVLWNVLTNPEYDPSPAADAIGKIVGILVVALTAYMAGRRINGHGS